MTFFQILSVALILTYFLAHFKDSLWAIVTVAGWWDLMAYTIANPPGGVTTGSFIHLSLILIFLGVGISSGAWYFFSEAPRQRASLNGGRKNNYQLRSKLDEDESDYRNSVHSALHPRRRNDL